MATYTKSQESENKYYTGITKGPVRLINPTKEQLAEARGYTLKDDAKGLEYEGRDKNGDDYVVISLWFETKDKKWFNHRFMITDKEQTSKAGNFQYVNQLGQSQYLDKEGKLNLFFTNFTDFKTKAVTGDKIYRKALKGEADFYDFYRVWLSGVKFDNQTNILMDTKKLFRNLDKFIEEEFRTLIKTYTRWENEVNLAKKETIYRHELLIGEVILEVVISAKEDAKGEIKYYPRLYNKMLSIKSWNELIAFIDKPALFESSKDSNLKNWYKQFSGQYGCKDIHEFCLLKEVNPADYQQGNNELLKEEGNNELLKEEGNNELLKEEVDASY